MKTNYTKMKTLALVAGILFSFNGFAQKPTGTSKPATVAKTSGSVKLSSLTDSMQYVLGAYLGQYINNTGFVINKPELFNKGMEDVLTGKPMLVPADSIVRRMDDYLKLTSKDRGIRLEKSMFETIKKQPGLGLLPSGVCYTIVKAGTGKRPLGGDSIQVHLKGYLADGKQFEDTYPKNIPYRTTPGSVIPGMSEVLQMMPAGSLWRVYIPSALAFGEKGISGLVPPYSALVYEVELLKVTENAPKTDGKK
jgi:FKBP-type peptidyl-prolyl cis-trans isomerase